MSVSAFCASIDTLVRSLRTLIVYFVSLLGVGSQNILVLLTLLHISVYITIELTHRYITQFSDSNTLLLGETYHALMVTAKFNEATDPVFDSGATSHVWNHLSHVTSFRYLTCGCLNIRVALYVPEM